MGDKLRFENKSKGVIGEMDLVQLEAHLAETENWLDMVRHRLNFIQKLDKQMRQTRKNLQAEIKRRTN